MPYLIIMALLGLLFWAIPDEKPKRKRKRVVNSDYIWSVNGGTLTGRRRWYRFRDKQGRFV